jgi:hypothetical protein
MSHHQATNKNYKMENSVYYRTEIFPFTWTDKLDMYVKQTYIIY